MNGDPSGGSLAEADDAAEDALVDQARALFADIGGQPVPAARLRSDALHIALKLASHPSRRIRSELPVVQVLSTTDPRDPMWPTLRTPREAAVDGVAGTTADQVPILVCDATDHRYRFHCPRCNAWHHHGPQPGHRVGHCGGTRGDAGIVILTLGDAVNLESVHDSDHTPLTPLDLDIRLSDGELRAVTRAAQDDELLDGLWRVARSGSWFTWHDVRLPRPKLNRLVVDGVLALGGSGNNPAWTACEGARLLKIITRAMFQHASDRRETAASRLGQEP